MKSTDIVQPQAMPSIFGEDIYSATSSTDFEIPAATSTSASDTCVMDDGFLPITSEPLDDGGIAPQRKNFNGLFYLSTDQRVYLQNGGFITFNEDVSTAIGGYPQGAVLGYLDANNNFMFVVSLIDDNTNNFVTTPSLIDNVNWKKAIDLSAYALKNLSNCTTGAFENVVNVAQSTGKYNVSSWGMPDLDSATSISLSGLNITTNIDFSVPSNGYVRARFEFTNGSEALYIDDACVFYVNSTGTVDEWTYFLPITSGTHTIRALFNALRITAFNFYPFKGA